MTNLTSTLSRKKNSFSNLSICTYKTPGPNALHMMTAICHYVLILIISG